MLITRAITLYVVAVFLAAALLAYPVHLTVVAAGFEQLPFHKLVTRLLKLFALLGLWPLVACMLQRRARQLKTTGYCDY